MMLQAFALMALTVTGMISVGQILVLGALLGVVSAVDATARQSFVIEMVNGHDDLGNAIAINSSVFNAARLLGPAVAGIVIGLCGEWPCFLLNGLSYRGRPGLALGDAGPAGRPAAGMPVSWRG